MPLIKVAVTKKNKDTIKKDGTSVTMLFNTKNIGRFADNNDGKCLFEYDLRSDRREKPDLYQATITSNQLHTKMNEPAGAVVLDLGSESYKKKHKQGAFDWFGKDERLHLPIDIITLVRDITDEPGKSWISTRNGAFEKIDYKTDHTVDEIDDAASQSGSLS